MRVAQILNLRADSESIYISVDYPSALDASYQHILTDCLWAYELVRHILYRSQVAYKNRLQAQEAQIDWTEFNGLHQMKDMDQVTDAGRAMRQYVTQKSIELARLAQTGVHAQCTGQCPR